MLSAVVAHSLDPDAPEAIAEILEQCQQQLQGKTPQAGLLLSAIDQDPQPLLDGVMDAFPELALIGGTTDGELSSVQGFQQDSVCLMLFCSEHLSFQAAVGRAVSSNPAAVTQAAVQQARDRLPSPPKLCLTVPEGLRANASAVLRGLVAALGEVPVVGGIAAEGPQARQTYQFCGREVLSDAVPILLVGGPLLVSHGFASGWTPMGRSGVVTQVEGNIIHTIDDQPAIVFYQNYFEKFEPDATYPLAVEVPGEAHFFLRGISGYLADSGSFVLAGEVPVGARVRMTDATRAEVVASAKTSLQQALQDYPGQQPAAALFFSCAWRRWVLGQDTRLEERAIAEFLQPTLREESAPILPYMGFYTFGEITPFQRGGPAVLHNTTFASLLLGTE